MKWTYCTKVACMVVVMLGARPTTQLGYHPAKIYTIVIDAGHGGKDPGCSGQFSKEKDITLQIALQLGALITKHMPGSKVIYTRKNDTFVPLHQRASIANKALADVFISIHCNASRNAKTQGVETHVMGLDTSKQNFELVKRENSVIFMEKSYKKHYPGFDPNAPESYILFSIYQHAYNGGSLKLAQHIQNEFKTQVSRKDRGVIQSNFVVLWKTNAPSVLVEVGFLTHAQEEKNLNNPAGQRSIAAAIFSALRNYKKEIDMQ